MSTSHNRGPPAAWQGPQNLQSKINQQPIQQSASHTEILTLPDIPDEHVLPVDYSTTRLSATLENTPAEPGERDIAIRLLTTKFRHWRYENEVRLLYRLEDVQKEVKDGKDLYFAPYFPWLELKEVILGPRSELEVEAVREIVEKCHPGVAVFRSRLAFRSYSVVRDRRSWLKRFGHER